MDTLLTNERKMDTSASTGWPMDTLATTGWSESQNISLQSIKDFRQHYSLNGSFGSSDNSTDQEQAFQHKTIFKVD